MNDTIIYLVRHAETVNENVKLVYNKNTILNIKSSCLLKLTFRKNELINLKQID